MWRRPISTWNSPRLSVEQDESAGVARTQRAGAERLVAASSLSTWALLIPSIGRPYGRTMPDGGMHRQEDLQRYVKTRRIPEVAGVPQTAQDGKNDCAALPYICWVGLLRRKGIGYLRVVIVCDARGIA